MELIIDGFKKKHRNNGITFLVLTVVIFFFGLSAISSSKSDNIQPLQGTVALFVVILVGIAIYNFLQMNNYKSLYSVLSGGKEEFDEITKDFENPSFKNESVIVGSKYMAGATPLAKTDTFITLEKLAILHVEVFRKKTYGITISKSFRICCYEDGYSNPKKLGMDERETKEVLAYFNDNYPDVFLGYHKDIIAGWSKQPYKSELLKRINEARKD